MKEKHMTLEKNNSLKTSHKTRGLKYLLFLPADYMSQKKWPLILFLHGAGEKGSNLEIVKRQGLPKIIEHGKELPFIVVAPQCPESSFWDMHLDELYLLLQEVKNEYAVDNKRIYLTGISMGGYGVWGLASKYPDEFAALVPICGGWENLNSILKLIDIPIWVFHGALDNIVPVDESIRLVKFLKQHNANIKLTIYPDLAHDSWTPTYQNDELYKWLLKQVKP